MLDDGIYGFIVQAFTSHVRPSLEAWMGQGDEIPVLDNDLQTLDLLSGNQTWLAGIWSMYQ